MTERDVYRDVQVSYLERQYPIGSRVVNRWTRAIMTVVDYAPRHAGFILIVKTPSGSRIRQHHRSVEVIGERSS